MQFHIFLLLYLLRSLPIKGRIPCYRPNTTIEICCSNFEDVEGKCTECRNGTYSNKGESCKECDNGFYGKNCIEECGCQNNERCSKVIGCVVITETTIDPTTKTKLTENNYNEEKTEWMMNLSISVAIFSLVVVVIVSVSKCCSKILENKTSAIKEITGKHHKMSPERKTNIYGTYGKQTIANDDEEYEFDSDNYAEDPYAVIRDSQILPETSLVGNDLNANFSLVVNHLDENFYTSGYNHLHLMGMSYKHGNQHDKMRSHSRGIYGSKFPTFQDME